MTGYGLAHRENERCTISVEVKSLNSKFLDCSVRLPKVFSDKELEVRAAVTDTLERGKVGISIDYSSKGDTLSKAEINEALFKAYYHQYFQLQQSVNAPASDLFKLALHSPEVMTAVDASESTKEDWPLVMEAIKEALQACNSFREDEGKTLKIKFKEYIQVITDLLGQVEAHDPSRILSIRNRISQNLNEWIGASKIDTNRFEQELIYYIEKLDISEEKVRLRSHLEYFIQVLETEKSAGKKLGFISQELGREINTIGSKANDASIQKWVVAMKDELEKIKEQLLNLI